MEKCIYLYFPYSFPPQGQEQIIFSVDGKKKKERKEFLNLETTVVADFHLIK